MNPKTFTLNEDELRANWREGPLLNGPLTPGHQRPITCLSMFADRIVTGSADHSLRVYNVAEGNCERELFTPKYGHNEWVTSCQLLADGRVFSGGMDSMLCLWDAEMVMCDYLLGHTGSITKVMVDDYNVGASSSYDHTIFIWDLTTKQEAQKLIGPHKSPVLDFDWHFSLLVSGDKDGYLGFWDINEGETFKTAKCHEGGVSQVLLFSDSTKHHLVLTTGISDGVLAMHDMRMNELVYSEKLHTGSVNSVKVNLSNLIVTGGSDGTINLVDIWSGFKHFGVMESTSPVYCVETIHNLTIAGAEDGNVLAYDNDVRECLWGFGAMESGAVKEIQITTDKRTLVATGEDITPIMLAFG